MNKLEQPLHIIIPGCPVVKKNTKRFASFRTDKKTGQLIPLQKPIMYYSEAYKEWAKIAVTKIVAVKQHFENKGMTFPIDSQVILRCLFYVNRNNIVDLSALYEGVQDLLIGKVGTIKSIPPNYYQILEDDSVRFIVGHDGSRLILDYSNPRTEIFIIPYSLEYDKKIWDMLNEYGNII